MSKPNPFNSYTGRHIATVLKIFMAENCGGFDYRDGGRNQAIKTTAKALNISTKEVRDIVMHVVSGK